MAAKVGPDSKFKNGAEAFNSLSQMPAKPIDLGDGRSLLITEWRPVANTEYTRQDHQVPITIIGRIIESERINGL